MITISPTRRIEPEEARAIECLTSIDKEDPEWFKAFSKVRKFLNNLETEWEAE